MNHLVNLAVIVFLIDYAFVFARARPNIIVVVTDDQDLILGGTDPIKKTKRLIKDEGAEFTNMFVSSPLCCPSRASIFSGYYSHNHGVINNSISGNCSSKFWQENIEIKAFVTLLKSSGYETFFAGKYLNQYGKKGSGGISHVPPGWDHWIGLVGNSCYYNYSLSVNGKPEIHGDKPEDYLTDIIFKRANDFLHAHESNSKPFFMMLSPPAPHSPFTPAPPHRNAFHNATAPRTPNFNFPVNQNKHWLLRQPPVPLPKDVIKNIDQVFRNRWRTLLSVDDGIENLYEMLLKKNILDNTYIFFTSDNGFHLGQFGLPWDKRQPYEFDIRVPLFVRGPRVRTGTKITSAVLNIDLAPTFLTLVGIKPPSELDGISFVSHLLSLKNDIQQYPRTFLIEHHGEATENVIMGCPQYAAGEVHTCEIDCICEDSWNNTYLCIRTVSHQENTIYCLFQDEEEFVEVYNLEDDPYQLQNLYLKNMKYKRSL